MGVTVTIWHNPRCSKSRDTLALLEAEGVAPEVRLYLNDPPDEEELRDLLGKLGIGAAGLVRTGERIYRDLGFGDDSDEALLIAAMAEHPVLIERPVVINGESAAIGRPPRNVLDIL